MIRAASHTAPALDPKKLGWIVNRSAAKLATISEQFDSIAFSGYSGALVAPGVCVALGKYPILVRKADDKDHSCYRLEGVEGPRKYIILDDFISCGDTLRYIMGKMQAERNGSVCVGIFEWRASSTTDLEYDLQMWDNTSPPGLVRRLAPELGHCWLDKPWENDCDDDDSQTAWPSDLSSFSVTRY